MVNKKSVSIFIMLSIFLVSISLGCSTKEPPQKNMTPPPQQNVTPPPQQAAAISTEKSNSQINVTVSSPMDGSKVNFTEPIIGNSTGVYGSGLHLYVLINPVETGDIYWVQPEATINRDGTWHVSAHFGKSVEENIGAQFWVNAIVTPNNLPVGQTNNVSSEFSTDSILVTRK